MTTPLRAPADAAAEPALDAGWLDHLPLPAGLIRGAVMVYVNRAFLELLQVSREDVVGKPFDERVAPEDRERIRGRHLQRVRGERVPDSYEFRVVQGSGARRMVEIFVEVRGETTVFQLHDVTERDRRQAALRALVRLGAAVQREQDDAAIFAAVGRGLNELGTDAVRFAPDPAGVRVVGALAPQERLAELQGVLGRPLGGLARPWSPSLERAWAEGAAYLDDPATGLIRFFGLEHGPSLRKLGYDQRLTRGVVLRIDVHGDPRELLMLLADWMLPEDLPALQLFAAQINAALDAARAISDLSRRNAELTALNRVATSAGAASELVQLYERASREIIALVDCAAVAFYLLDPTGACCELAFTVGGSEEARKALQRVPVEGTRLGEVVRGRQPRVWYLADFPEDRRKLLRGMGHEVVISVPMLVRSRVVGVINVSYERHRELSRSELEILAAMGVHLAAAVESARLIDDLRRSYEELSVAHAQLVQQERLAAIGEMAAAVAHEVRNPLGVVFNALSSLRRELSPEPRVRRLVEMLGEESERINHLVDDLLVFARPASPELSPGVALEPLLAEAVRAAVQSAPAAIEVALTCGEGLGQVALDTRLMRQVFLNVAQNSVQAMPRGGSLEVRAARVGICEVAVEFRDQGGGIPPEVLPRIFEPFFTTRARGTGLGLALVKRIVEGHRGRVQAQSTRGEGTVIRIVWPGLERPASGRPVA